MEISWPKLQWNSYGIQGHVTQLLFTVFFNNSSAGWIINFPY